MSQNFELPGPREVPGDLVRGMSAQDAVVELLRRQRVQAAEAEKRVQLEQDRADRLAGRVGLEVYKKRRSDQAAAFRGIAEILGEEGVTLITHEGEPLTAALEEASDIFEWLPADGPGPERVLEALEPEIRRDGRLIHRAKLSCMQAAPEDAPVGETVEAPSPPEGAASPEEAAPASANAVSAPDDTTPAEAVPAPEGIPVEAVPLLEHLTPADAAPAPEDVPPAEAAPAPEDAPPSENATGAEGRAAAPWYDWIVQKAMLAGSLAKTGTRDAVRGLKDLLNTVRGGKTP
jgi:hypothetical protein